MTSRIHDVNPLDPADTQFGNFRQNMLDAEMQH